MQTPAPPLAICQPHATAGRSIEADQTSRLSHTHALYNSVNLKFYCKLEEAVRGTEFEVSIKPYQLTGTGRTAYLLLLSQHTGKDKWMQIVRQANKYVTQRKWDGTTGLDLQSHINKCRDYYVELETAAQFVAHQISLPLTRVQNLLNSIGSCNDPKIAAGVAAITIESNGTHDNWEAVVVHLLLVCSVAAKFCKKWKYVQISSLTEEGLT